MSRLFVRREAERDIARASRWYEDRRQGLGEDFLRSIGQALARIAREPERFPILQGRVRRALVTRFPYAVFFVLLEKRISVVAVLHLRMHWRRLRRRLSG